MCVCVKDVFATCLYLGRCLVMSKMPRRQLPARQLPRWRHVASHVKGEMADMPSRHLIFGMAAGEAAAKIETRRKYEWVM